jgi:hypothetical protein
MPHKLAYQTPDDVDFRIMSTFVEFYSIMLGFVNFKSYQDIGLIYPPKVNFNYRLFEFIPIILIILPWSNLSFR